VAFSEAIKEASKNTNYHINFCNGNGKNIRGKSAHGALLIRDKKTISRGFNRPGNKLSAPRGYKNIHAECQAIRSAREEGDIVFVVRVSRSGQVQYSRPCELCIEFMRNHGIKKIYYSDHDGSIKKEKI